MKGHSSSCVGGLSGSDCVAGDGECEDVEKTHGKHHSVDFSSTGLQLTQYGVHSLEEVLDEPIDIRDHGRFQIMLTDPMDPHVVLKSRRVWQGESSSKRERLIQSGCNDMSSRPRLDTHSLSHSFIDTSIVDGNRRLRGRGKGEEELRLWEIAKELGVVCQVSEERAIQRFSELEKRDNSVMREASHEEGNRTS